MGVEEGVKALTCECRIDPNWPSTTWSEDQQRESRCEEHKTNYMVMTASHPEVGRQFVVVSITYLKPQ